MFLLSGCAPKMVVKNYNENNSHSATKFYESFALIEEAFLEEPLNKQLIAEIEIKDKGLSINCDYETVKRLAEEKARQMGGNCLVITDHIEPNMKSTCHRIKCQVLRIDNPEKYEKQISWHPNRPLKISNFRGDINKRPFQAATYSLIRYFASVNPINGKAKIRVESLFDCDLSYFKNSDRDSFILAHEQLHFDITEIHARKFKKKILKETKNYNEFSAKHESMFLEIQKELSIKQDEYDSEVYADWTLQPKWNKWVIEELNKLEAFSEKEIVLE